MFLKNIKLNNFRNFSQVEIQFAPLTLLLGRNAQGKSNLLEAIYFLATTKSPRAEKDVQLIKQSENFVRVEGEVVEELRSMNYELREESNITKLEIVMQKKEEGELLEKRVKVNGVGRRVVDYIGNLVVVYFSPEDINLVTGPPALRRWHIDLTLAQVDKDYKNAISAYSQALVSRNRLLKKVKEGQAQVMELDFWTDQMIQTAETVTTTRKDFFQQLNGIISSSWEQNKLGKLKLIYEESVLSKERLKDYLVREIAAGLTLIGPQRDDFWFEFNDHNLAAFGSRGEQRTVVLELKLAQLKFISHIKNTAPVLLLDDIFSELDEEHRQFVVSLAQNQQTVLSAVEETQVPQDLLKGASIVRVEKGTVKPLW